MMKLHHWLPAVCIVAAFSARAQTLDLDELIGEVMSNVDLAAVAEVTGVEEKQLRAAGRELQEEFQGEYVVEVGSNEWRFAIPPPTLELPVPPAPAPTPEAKQLDWPVGADVYVRQLKPVFVEEGVPAELVWLAEVESGFVPWARSRVGAAGLFQLMPDTAELLGLSLKPVDERFIPAKSARAAARYVKYLHDKFGDWRLTLAAYNAGEGRVRRLLDQYRTRRYDTIAPALPPETRLYVPKVETILQQREGIALNDLKLPKPRR